MKLERNFFIILFVLVTALIIYTNVGIKEMDNFKVWNNAYKSLGQKTSYRVQEDIELTYTKNNQEIKQSSRKIVDLINYPYIQKNVGFQINDDIASEPEQLYYLHEDNSIYVIQNIKGNLVKHVVNPNDFYRPKVSLFSFILNHIPINMIKSEENKFEYTYKFKLKQYSDKYYPLFDELVNELNEKLQTNNSIDVLDEELLMTINLDDKYQFTKITVDLTAILQGIIGNQAIKDYSLVYKYTFSNYDNVTIDENEYNQAIFDNAPNEIDDFYLYPQFITNKTNAGEFEYGYDVDVYHLSIRKAVKYQIKIDTNVNYRFNVIDVNGQIVNPEQDGNLFNFEPGIYFLVLENLDNKIGNYNIDSVNKTNSGETAVTN